MLLDDVQTRPAHTLAHTLMHTLLWCIPWHGGLHMLQDSHTQTLAHTSLQTWPHGPWGTESEERILAHTSWRIPPKRAVILSRRHIYVEFQV